MTTTTTTSLPRPVHHFSSLPFPQWTPEARAKIASSGGVKPRVLLVAASDLACALLHDAVADGTLHLKPLGALLVSGVSSRGNAVEPAADDNSGIVHEVVGGDVVIAAARYDVPAAAVREWSDALIAAVAPERVVVVGAVDEHDVDYGADGRRGSYVMDTAAMRRVDTTAASSDIDVDSSAKDDDAVAPPVPPGALITGVAAGVLSRCEMKGRGGVLHKPSFIRACD